MQRDLNVAVAEFTELKQQLERDTLVLSVLKKLQEVRRGSKTILLLGVRHYLGLCFGCVCTLQIWVSVCRVRAELQ